MSVQELDRWHDLEVEEWRERWALPALRVFRSVGSTNDIAGAMAREGVEEGALVLTEEQTSGRGRRGRVWIAPPGVSLSLSMVLRPTGEGTRLLTLRLGLAAAEAVETLAPVSVGLKWPNDLVIEGRKVGGILCEGESLEGRMAHVIAGMGINLAEPDDGWPAAIRERATSLAAAGASLHPPDFVGVLSRLWLDAAPGGGTLTAVERAAFDRRDVLRGRAVRIDGRPAGTAMGVGATGALRVERHGVTGEVFAGTVRTEPEGRAP
jgi:BirA family biotin operon repressor/biotin-[acetyl-CoA-carboxylase] ligase